MEKIITKSFKETRKLGEKLAEEFSGGVICLEGDLGSGKTTFVQGVLRGLGASGPYTSPTFVIMKEYVLKDPKAKIKKIYHIDAYRIEEKDMSDLGWRELINDPGNLVIVEWPERIKNIIPTSANWITFEWLGENERRIDFSSA